MAAKSKPARDRSAASGPLRDEAAGAAAACTLPIKAIPNAPRSEVAGWLGDALKVKVHAPPVEGRANDALCEFLADTLRLPRRAVTVVRGDTSRQKLVRISGLTLVEVKSRLNSTAKSS